jgi:hypothetical protein
MKKTVFSTFLVLAVTASFAQAGQRERVKEIQQSVKDGGFWYLFKWLFWGGCSNCYGFQQKESLKLDKVYFLKKEELEKTYWM